MPPEYTELLTIINNKIEHMKLHEIFEQVVRENPNAIAAKFQEKEFTYQQINELANKLANLLKTKLPDDLEGQPIIGVHLFPSENPLIAMLAISKLGGIYLPLSPGAEAASLETICNNTPPHIVIHEENLDLKPLHLNEKCVAVSINNETIIKEVSACSAHNLDKITTPDQDLIAYYIFSSGTTGAPKCIPIAHRGLGKWAEKLKELKNDSERAVLSHIPMSFDAHIWEYIMAWSLQAPICVAGDELRGNRNPGHLAQFIADHKITDVTIVPTLLTPIVSLQDSEFACKNNKLNIYCTGEAIPRSLIEACLNLDWKFFNCYGPTEATFGFTIDEIKWVLNEHNNKRVAEGFADFNFKSKFEGFDADEGVQRNDLPPIGQPYNNEIEVFMLDENNQVITDGRPGQLAYASPDMTKGYLNNTEDNQKKFAEIKVDGREQPVRVHLTGDMFAKKEDKYYCLGRIGSSAKISGTLFEGKGIEETIQRIEGVTQVAVVKVYNPERMVAVYTAGPDNTPENIRNALKSTFDKPLPIVLYKVDRMPVTANSNKLDSKKLESMASTIKRDTPFAEKPATTRLQKELVTLWAELLKGHGISAEDIQISDDFGVLGANSSDRNRLCGEIKNKYNVDLDQATLWADNFNIENLDNIIYYEKFKPELIKKPEISAQNPPFFLLPSITGDGPREYGKLGAELKKQEVLQAVYAFKSPGLINRKYIQLSIDQLIDHYFTLLKIAQPKGPYYLGGWSSGALIAHGVALRLKENGDEVRYLALIDEAAPKNRNSYQPEIFATELLTLIEHLPASLSTSISKDELSKKTCDEQVKYVFENLKVNTQIENAQQRLNVVKSFLVAMLNYQPKKSKDIDLHILYTDKTLEQNRNNKKLNWEGRVTCARVGDNHFSPVNAPEETAKQLALELKKPVQVLSSEQRRPSDPFNKALREFTAEVQNIITYVCQPERKYNASLALELLDTLISCYARIIYTFSNLESPSKLAEYRETDKQFWTHVFNVAKLIRKHIKPVGDPESSETSWVKDMRELGFKHLTDKNDEHYHEELFPIEESVNNCAPKLLAQSWSSLIQKKCLHASTTHVEDGYDSDTDSTCSRDSGEAHPPTPKTNAVDAERFAEIKSQVYPLSVQNNLRTFIALTDTAQNYWQWIEKRKPLIPPSEVEEFNNGSPGNTGSTLSITDECVSMDAYKI